MAKNLVLARAQNAVMAHDWTTAARLYKELLQGNESNVDYLKELGGIYVKAGEDEKAIPYYEQIITFYPHYIDAMNSLGAIYRRLKRYEESILILQRALEEDRNTAAVHYNLGFTYKEMGNYEDAIESFETVIAENPDDVLAYNHLGSIYYTQKNYERSIASFKRGLQVDPNHPILNYNLARCYDADKNYAEAVRCYETTLKTRPGWTDAIRDFSELLIKCQDNKKAQTLVEKSIKLHPRDVDLLCILGRIFINQFDYDSATQTYKKANSLDSNNIKVLVGFSEALEKGSNVGAALDKALEAIEIDPYNKDVRKQYARTLLSNQRYDQAYENIMSLNEETNEQDPQVLDLCAQYYICRGDETAAKNYHEKIQRVNHHYKDHMLNASDRFVQIGDLDKAEEYAKQFVERRGQLPDGYNRLGAIYQAKGDLKNAKLNFEKGKTTREPNVIAEKALKEVDEKLAANPEIYEYETPVIEVDADKVQTEEDYVPSSFVGEVVGAENEENQQNQTEDENFDYSQLGDNVPMGEALVESEDNFWEDFDDDPNAEPKSLVNEENLDGSEDEEELTEDNLDDDIFASLGGSEPSNELAEDSDFDFGDLPDSETIADEVETDNSAEVEPENTAQENFESPERSEPEVPVSTPEYSAPVRSAPVQEEAPVPRYQPAYEPAYDRQMQSAAINSADRAMDAAFMAQKMVQQLADQQKSFEESISAKNQQMIHEEVEKAVEEKIQKSMDTQMERIMAAEEEDVFGDVEEFAVEEDLAENTVPEPVLSEAEGPVEEENFVSVEEMTGEESQPEESTVVETAEDLFLTVDELIGEEAEPIADPFAEAEDMFDEVDQFMGEEAEPIIPQEILPEDDFDAVEDFAGEEVVEDEPFGDVSEFAGDEPAAEEVAEEEPFGEVDEFAEDESLADAVVPEPVLSEAEGSVEGPFEEDAFGDVSDFAGDEPADEEVAEEAFGEVDEFAEDESSVDASAPEPVEGQAEEENFASVEELMGEEIQPEEDPFGDVNDFAEDEPVEEDQFGDVSDFAGDEPAAEEVAEEAFGEVDDFAADAVAPELVEGPAEEDTFGEVSDFAEDESMADAAVPEPVLSEAEGPVEEPVAETVIPSIPAEYADQIELFKTLRVLSGFLPEGENDSFLSCRIRMMIEYIIAKMSGKPGLLITAKALLESGALGEDYDKQLTAEAEDDVSNAMITHVLKYMKKLAASLQDDKLSKALCLSADNILERIELEDQKSQIF